MALTTQQENTLCYAGGEERGYCRRQAERDGSYRTLSALHEMGLVHLPTRGWGWRLTRNGKTKRLQILAKWAARNEEIRTMGFDPDKPLSEMTREEVLAFVAVDKGA